MKISKMILLLDYSSLTKLLVLGFLFTLARSEELNTEKQTVTEIVSTIPYPKYRTTPATFYPTEETPQKKLEILKNEIKRCNDYTLKTQNEVENLKALFETELKSLRNEIEYLSLRIDKEIYVKEIIEDRMILARNNFYKKRNIKFLKDVINETYNSGHFDNIVKFIATLDPADAMIGFKHLLSVVESKGYQTLVICQEVEGMYGYNNSTEVLDFKQGINDDQIFKTLYDEIHTGKYNQTHILIAKYPKIIKELVKSVLDGEEVNESFKERLKKISSIAKHVIPIDEKLSTICAIFDSLSSKLEFSFDDWQKYLHKEEFSSIVARDNFKTLCPSYPSIIDLTTQKMLHACDQNITKCLLKDGANLMVLNSSESKNSRYGWNYEYSWPLRVGLLIPAKPVRTLVFSMPWFLSDIDWRKGLYTIRKLGSKEYVILQDTNTRYDLEDFTVFKITISEKMFN